MCHFEGLHLVHAAHAVGFHRGYRLMEQDEVEAGEGLDGWMVGDAVQGVAVRAGGVELIRE